MNKDRRYAVQLQKSLVELDIRRHATSKPQVVPPELGSPMANEGATCLFQDQLNGSRDIGAVRVRRKKLAELSNRRQVERARAVFNAAMLITHQSPEYVGMDRFAKCSQPRDLAFMLVRTEPKNMGYVRIKISY